MVHTLSDVLRCAAKGQGSDPCWIQQSSVLGEDRTLSYASAVQCVDQHVHALRESMMWSFSASDITIVFLCNNCIDFALSILAASQVAATLHDTCVQTVRSALLNTRWSVSDMETALRPADDSILIVYGIEWQGKAEKLREKLQQRVRTETMPLPTYGQRALAPIISCPDVTAQTDATNESNSEPMPLTKEWIRNLSPKDAVLVFTSGTTSTAKGVRLSHRALLVQAAAKVAPPCGYSRTTRMLATTVPFFHVGGLSSLLAVWMTHGALTEPPGASVGFSASTVWESISRQINPLNTLVVVPTMVHALQQVQMTPQFQTTRGVAFPHVDLILVGGQSLTRSQQTFLRNTFPAARIVQTFACTEAASSLTFWDVTEPLKTDSSAAVEPSGVCVGSPPPHVQLQLFATSSRDTRASIISQPYQVGLIATLGPHVMNGYWGQEHRKQDDWYIASDLGFWDKVGRLYFCGRETDTIRTGGETVWATEIEQVLHDHPVIAEVAVLGLPDERFGETVACGIVLQPNSSLTIEELRRWCKREGLTGYKQPRRLVVLRSLPRNTSGKILKHRLKDSFEDVPRSRL